jgi:ferric-dicitrate binding protein FerR (iron transport regulator)
MSRRALSRLAVLAACAGVATAGPALGNPPRTKNIQGPGEVTIVSLTNGATIEIDGKIVGTVPLEESIVVLAGKHTIRVSKRGYKAYVDEFEVGGGQVLELEIDLIPYAGLVKVTTPEPGATVKVDGQVEGVTPLDKDIPAGKRLFSVSQEGFIEESREADIIAGAEANLHFLLRPMPAATSKTSESSAVYTQWWFWTLIGVAGAGAAAAIAVGSGGETLTPSPRLSIDIP